MLVKVTISAFLVVAVVFKVVALEVASIEVVDLVVVFEEVGLGAVVVSKELVFDVVAFEGTLLVVTLSFGDLIPQLEIQLI